MTVHCIPADGAETAAEGIPALLVFPALLLYGIERAGKCCDRCLLHRVEHTEIDLRMQFTEGLHDIRAADKEADTSTGQIEALG